MIARRWTARATVDGGRAYLEFFQSTLAPALAHIDGHCGALVFDRQTEDGVEVTVLTFWESMDAIERFTSGDPQGAVVEPEAQAVLRDYDRAVEHLTLRMDTFLG